MPLIVTGIPEFERRLESLDLFVQRQALTKAVKIGAAAIRDEAEKRAPRLDESTKEREAGFLASHIIVKISGTESSAREVSARIGPAKDAFYGKFGELGNAFQVPQPWLLPAFERKIAEALQRATEMMKETIEAFR